MQRNRSFVLMACIALLTVFFSETVIFAKPPTQTSSVTFKTPEDAINAYLEGVVQNDYAKIMQACAVDEMSENFQFDLYVERLRALPFEAPAPSDYPLYMELNKAQFSSQISLQIKTFAYSLLAGEGLGEGKLIIMSVDEARVLMKAANPSRLTDLEVKKIETPNKKLMAGERYKTNAEKLAHVYGADESTERVVLFTFEQNYYYMGFSLLRYGDNWKIYSQGSPLANTSALGTPEKTTEAAFENMVNGN